MKGNFFLNEEGKSDFDNALEMLDNSVGELRQVASNLLPEALIKLGLKEALSDYCTSLENAHGPILMFCFYGEHQRIDQTLEIALYRIAQEIIHNAIKHSGVSEILIDLVQDHNRVSLSVLDNGRGFNIAQLPESYAMRLHSLKSRVNILKGSFEINSIPDQGTEIRVEFS